MTGPGDTSKENPIERKAVFGIVCGSHLLNHFQSSMVGVLYPFMMKELGFGYIEIGFLTAAYNMVSNLLQATYGFIAMRIKRADILGLGNVTLGLSVVATGLAPSYRFVFGTRLLGGLGASPQHPIGSSMLASYYGGARGRALAIHSIAGNLGTLLAPTLAGILLLYMGWRGVFYLVGIPSVLMGTACFLLRGKLRHAPLQGKKSRLSYQGWEAYKQCLKNRNILVVSLVLMAGAAGRGQGINVTYLIPHFVNDLHVHVGYAAFLFTVLQIGGLVGPIFWGWVSDRFSRSHTIQVSLFLSAVTTLWLAWQSTVSPWLLANLVLYGTVVTSRQTLTQALLSDVAEEKTLDAAFSLYYFIGFASAPFWTLLTGWIMEGFGFSHAFSVISVTYLLGMVILLFLREPKKAHGS
ncbi:MAG: MFS transporter [Deltaproteobacteria bacterium]|nr:MFS transporter [Deltaproteobacteria bacterium]